MLASTDEPKPGEATPNRVEAAKIEAAKNDLAQRTTARVARRGYCPLPTDFLRLHSRFVDARGKRLNPSEVLLLIHLYSFKRGPGHPFPAIDTLAQRLGVTDRAVRKMLHHLEKCQLVRRIYDGQRRKSNRYDLSGLWQKVEALIDADNQALLKSMAAGATVGGGA